MSQPAPVAPRSVRATDIPMEATQHGNALTDVELLLCARDDPEAFCAFYRRYARPVYAWLVQRVENAETANELTAETFAQALCSVKRFRGESEGAAVGWLF